MERTDTFFKLQFYLSFIICYVNFFNAYKITKIKMLVDDYGLQIKSKIRIASESGVNKKIYIYKILNSELLEIGK